MEFQVLAKSYNSYGWHATLSLIGDFLLMGSGDFGQAVEELTVTLYLADPGPPKKTLEQLLQRHNSYRSTLPKIAYRKAKKQVEIAVASELLVGRKWASSPALSLPLFEQGVDEVCQALSLMRKRFSGADDFDLGGFRAHCAIARHRCPRKEEDLQDLSAKLKAARRAKRDAMSPWEKLNIDWEKFHSKARELLDDPFFWDESNDFSPNGNDTTSELR